MFSAAKKNAPCGAFRIRTRMGGMFPDETATLKLLNCEQIPPATAYLLLLDHHFFIKLTKSSHAFTTHNQLPISNCPKADISHCPKAAVRQVLQTTLCSPSRFLKADSQSGAKGLRAFAQTTLEREARLHGLSFPEPVRYSLAQICMAIRFPFASHTKNVMGLS